MKVVVAIIATIFISSIPAPSASQKELENHGAESNYISLCAVLKEVKEALKIESI